MIELLLNRRSCRKFKAVKIKKEHETLLCQAALLSPSSRGLKPWEFIFIDNPEYIMNLSKAKVYGSAFAGTAPLILVIAGNTETSDVWIEDCSIAAILVQLEAEKLGIGSCWVQLRNRDTQNGESSSEYVKKIFNLPEKFEIPFFIALGYPDEKKIPYEIDKLDILKIHRNGFSK